MSVFQVRVSQWLWQVYMSHMRHVGEVEWAIQGWLARG